MGLRRLQWLVRILVGVAVLALVSVAHAQDVIRDAVKLRLEKSQEPEIDLEIKAVKGEPPSPIAPQAFDGYGGVTHEPFAPDPIERIKWAKEEAEKRRKEDLIEAKKIAAEKKSQLLAERESGKGKKTVAGKSGDKRAPAGKPGSAVKKGTPLGTQKSTPPKAGKGASKKPSGKKAPPSKAKGKPAKK
jgi:hypothetical protein